MAIPNKLPKIPGLVIVNVDPNISSALRVLLLALKAKSDDDLANPTIFFSSQDLITGTIKLLSGRATATPRLILL